MSILERKYRRHRGLNDINKLLPSRARPLDNLKDTASIKENFYRHNYLNNNKQWRRYPEEQTPIKSIPKLPLTLTPSRIEPNSLYKTFTEETPVTRVGSIRNRNRKYKPKNEVKQGSRNGLFDKLKAYFGSLNLENCENELSDLSSLKDSVKKVLNITEKKKPNKRVCFGDDQQLPRYSSHNEEFDPVDTALAGKTTKIDSAFLIKRIKSLQTTLEEQRQLTSEKENHYHDNLEKLKVRYEDQRKEYMARIQELITKLKDNQKSQTSIEKEKEDIFLQQREESLKIRKKKDLLEKMENELISQREVLDVAFKQLETERENFKKLKAELENQRKLYQERKNKQSGIEENLVLSSLEDTLNSQRKGYRHEKNLLFKESSRIHEVLQKNKNDYIHYLERLMETYQTLLELRSTYLIEFIKNFELLLETLSNKDFVSKPPSKFEAVRRRCQEYNLYLAHFKDMCSAREYDLIPSEYKLDSLSEANSLFLKLQDSFSKAFSKKLKKVSAIESDLFQAEHSEKFTEFDIRFFKEVALKFEKRNSLLLDMKMLNQLLLMLASLVHLFNGVSIVLRYLPDLSSLDKVAEYLPDNSFIDFSL